jgi:hypothetical protein
MLFQKNHQRLLRTVLLLAAYAMTGCASSNTRLVRKATANVTYYRVSYIHKCEGSGNPSERCGPCESLINDGIWKVQAANQNLQVGYLPPAEIVELDGLIDSLATCP